MRPEAELAGLVWDALEFARNARTAVGDTSLEDYLKGGLVAWGTERQMELIGEVLGKLRQSAPELAERVPNADKIIGMRNILIHGYLVVNPPHRLPVGDRGGSRTDPRPRSPTG